MSALKQAMMDALVGSCEETGERLSDRLEGQLRGLRRLRVAAHLSRCDRCRAVLHSLTRTVDQVRELGRADFAPPPNESVAGNVLDRIRHERP